MNAGDRVKFNGLNARPWETVGTVSHITGDYVTIKWDAGKNGYLHKSQVKVISNA